MKHALLALAICIVGCRTQQLPQDRLSRVVLHEDNGTEHVLRNVVDLGRCGRDYYVVSDSSIYVGTLPNVGFAATLGVTSAVSINDTLFLATPHGLRRLWSARNTMETIELPARNSSPAISALAVDPRGRLWIGTDGFGLFVRDQQRIVGSATARYVRAVAAHPDSSIWIGSDMGVLHLKDSVLRHYSEEITSEGIEIKDNVIDMITVDREGTIWIGTSQGINVVPNDVARRAAEAHHEVPSFDYIGRKGNAVHCVIQREAPTRDWLLGTDDGLFVLDIETVPEGEHHHVEDNMTPRHASARRIIFQSEQTPTAVRALLWTDDHGLLVGTSNGLIFMPSRVASTLLDDR